MNVKTKIEISDGSYNTPARLEITLEVPRTISAEQHKKLRQALADIQAVYSVYRPAKNEAPK